MMLAEIIAVTYAAPPMRAQAPEPRQLTISILEGEGAINNIRQRTAREAIVQVQDENHKPVAGVAVTFFLADHGASGVFSNGSQSLTVMTGTDGQASMRMVPNNMAGKMEIRVSARLGNLNADAVITQTNVAAGAAAGAGAAAISGKVIALIVVVAVGAAVGAVVATRGGSSASTATTPPAAITITPGTPTVGAP
jgi:hypothetical protein